MESIAVKVLDPAGQHWAQLLDPRHAVNQLIPDLVGRLALPTELKYELVPEETGRALGVNDTLLSAGIAAGAELLLRPVRDGMFVAFLDALYDQAIKFAAEHLWNGAKSSLETLYRLDPDYPDKQGLWKQIATSAAKGVGAAGTAATAVSGAASTGATVASGAVSAGRTAARGASRSSGSTFGCLIVLVCGVLVCWVVLIFVNVLPAPDWMSGIIPQQGGSSMAQPGEPQLGTGDVQVTLRWDTQADIDLHVTDPMNEEIYFAHRTANSGGQLDVDANAGCSNDPRVENIFWPTGGSPSGTYQIEVDYYNECGAGATNYEVIVRVDGRVVDTQTGTLYSSSDRVDLRSFTR